MKQVVYISRFVLAALFLFSGFVKSVDPMGTSIKMTEYMYSFGWERLVGLAPWLAAILCAAELLIGLLLLTGIFKRITSYAVLLFMGFFTLMTFYILVAEPVSDCGCFGDAIKLSNTATFVKNLFFMAIAVFYFQKTFKRREKASLLTAAAAIPLVAISFGIPVYSMEYLPVTDFLPYKTGVNLRQAMDIPDDAPQSEYETTLVYKNRQDGSLHEFSVEDTTWYDTSKWEYADTKTTLVSQGYVPEIRRFPLLDKEGADRLDQILADSASVFLVVMPERGRLSEENIQTLQKLNRIATENHAGFIILTADDLEETDRFFSERNMRSESYNADGTILKSLIRSRGHQGILLMQGGTILAKWNLNRLPDFKTFADIRTATERQSLVTLWFYLIVSALFCSAVYLVVRQQKKIHAN